MAKPVIRNVTDINEAAAATPFYVNLPTGTVAGDLLLAIFSKDDDLACVSNSGMVDAFAGGLEGVDYISYAYWKIATATDIANGNVSFSGDANEEYVGRLYRIDGINPTNPILAVSAPNLATSNAPIALTLDTVVDNLVFAFFGADDDDVPYSITTAGWTENLNATSSDGQCGILIATRDANTAGATGSCVFTMNASDGWAAGQISINGNISPTVALGLPNDGDTVTDTTPDLKFTGTDVQEEAVEYEVQVDTSDKFVYGVLSAVYFQEISVADKEIFPRGLFFKPDGLKMYTTGSEGGTVDEYNLSEAWNVLSAVYFQEISVADKETDPQGLFFKPDGLKMYTIGSSGDTVDEYNLSEAWNVLSAVYFQEISVADKEIFPRGLFFKPDGLKMYTTGSDGDTVDEYNLSEAWNVLTAVYFQEISVADKETDPQDLFFKSDGLKMYTIGSSGDTVDEYNLSEAWNVLSAVYFQEISVAGKELTPQGLFFKPDGLKMYTIGSSGDTVDEYNLSPFPLIDALSTDETGFSAGAAHPTASGVEQTYTVQIELDAGTYFWRVRAKDPAGTNQWGEWSPGDSTLGYDYFIVGEVSAFVPQISII